MAGGVSHNRGVAANLKDLPKRPSIALANQKAAVRAATTKFRAANPRIFGSVLEGADADDSDLDILVDALPGATLFDLGALQITLAQLLGVRVDVLTPGDLPVSFRDAVLAEAQPI